MFADGAGLIHPKPNHTTDAVTPYRRRMPVASCIKVAQHWNVGWEKTGHVCIYVYVYVHIYICTHTDTRLCIHTYGIHTYIYIYICKRTLYVLFDLCSYSFKLFMYLFV